MTQSKTPKPRNHQSRQHPRRTIADRDAAIAVLRELLQGDEEQQRKTWRYLMEALDELRPEGGRLFPPTGPGSRGLIPRTAKDVDWDAWDRKAAIETLRRFVEEGDPEEQRETFEALARGIDENRPEGHKLFS